MTEAPITTTASASEDTGKRTFTLEGYEQKKALSKHDVKCLIGRVKKRKAEVRAKIAANETAEQRREERKKVRKRKKEARKKNRR